MVIPPMECRPPQKKWAALPRGPVSSWVLANNAVNGAPGTWGSSAWRLDVLPGGAQSPSPRWNAVPTQWAALPRGPVSPWVLAADAANGWAWQSCSSPSPSPPLPRRPAPRGRNRPRPHPRLGRSRWTPRRGIHSWGAPWGFLPSRPGRLAGHSSGPWRAPSSERPSARGQLGGWPRPAVGGVFADTHGLVGACVVMLAVVSQLRRRCRGAVASTIATMPSRSCGRPPRVRVSSALSVALGFATLSAES